MQSLEPSLYENHAAQVELWLQENPLPEDAAVSTQKKKEAEENDEDKAEEEEEEEEEEEDEAPEKVESDEVIALRQMRATKVRELELFISASAFIQVLDKGAGPVLESMLQSKNSSDAIEAMKFFVQAYHFNLPCASKGLRSSWSLAWSNEKNVVDDVCSSFLLVHAHKPGAVQVGKKDDVLPTGKVAMNLINVVQQANNDERTCLEELFGNLVKENCFEKGVFAALRNGAIEGKQAKVRASAMLVLSMAANSDPTVLGGDKQLEDLVVATLGQHKKGEADWEQIRCACLAIKSTSKNIVKTKEGDFYFEQYNVVLLFFFPKIKTSLPLIHTCKLFVFFSCLGSESIGLLCFGAHRRMVRWIQR
jgi:condensin complex subunit 1